MPLIPTQAEAEGSKVQGLPGLKKKQVLVSESKAARHGACL